MRPRIVNLARSICFLLSFAAIVAAMCKGSGTQLLDKLAQLPPDLKVKQLSAPDIMKKRARSKWYTQQFVNPLLHLGSDLHRYYMNAMNCGHMVQITEGMTKSTYCNTRVCNVCNRIRTAKAMNGYLSQLEGRSWVMLTLTDRNCSGNELREELKNYKKSFFLIRRQLSERKGLKIDGIVKAEITYNEARDDYHPHLHILIASEQLEYISGEIVRIWLDRRPSADIKAQNISRANQDSLNELFKYTTKTFSRSGKEFYTNPEAIDTIMKAQYNTRSFQPFGSIRKVSEEVSEIVETQPLQIEEGVYMWASSDWYNIASGEALSGYEPDPEVRISPKYGIRPNAPN